jgi:hypothetical protein
MGNAKKLKSREYPAVNLRQAVEFARRIYEKDRWNEVPAAVSVRHLGYSGLHGKSRSALSALKKYGLVEYLSSGENLRIKLSDRSKRIFTPVREDETSEAIWEALSLPQINAEVLEKYPDWELPSQETFANVLERDFRMQHGAAQSYIADLCASLEFARSYKRNEEPTNSQDEDVLRPIPESNSGFTQRLSNSQAEVSVGTIRVQMPSSPTYMTLPEKLEPKDAKRILKWIETVVTPTIKFAASDDDNGIGPTEEI